MAAKTQYINPTQNIIIVTPNMQINDELDRNVAEQLRQQWQNWRLRLSHCYLLATSLVTVAVGILSSSRVM